MIELLVIFVLATLVGVELIKKVPSTLHTPLMSGSNAISGITIVGAVLVAGSATGVLGTTFGCLAVALAMAVTAAVDAPFGSPENPRAMKLAPEASAITSGWNSRSPVPPGESLLDQSGSVVGEGWPLVMP